VRVTTFGLQVAVYISEMVQQRAKVSDH